MLKVIWEPRPASVAFSGRIESDKDSRVGIDVDFFAQKFQVGVIGLDSELDDLDLLADRRKLVFQQAVELIKASPRSASH